MPPALPGRLFTTSPTWEAWVLLHTVLLDEWFFFFFQFVIHNKYNLKHKEVHSLQIIRHIIHRNITV